MKHIGPLSRKRTRLCILLLAAGIVLLVLCLFTNQTVGIVGLAVVLAGAFARPSGCRECGKTVYARPQWSAPGRSHCPHCGARMVYDDEPEAQTLSRPPAPDDRTEDPS